MNDPTPPVPDQIMAAMASRNLTRAELSRRSETPLRTLYRALSGTSEPDNLTMGRLARALGVSLTRPALTFNPDGSIQ